MNNSKEKTSKTSNKSSVDMLLPGADTQDSGNSSFSSQPSTVLDTVSLHSTSLQAPICTTSAASIGPQLLVDPSTGQHYFIPSTATHPQTQIFYQPLYYAPSTARPIYYAQGAYVMSFPGGQSSGIQVISPHTPLNYHYSTSATVPTEAFSRNSVKPEEIRNPTNFDVQNMQNIIPHNDCSKDFDRSSPHSLLYKWSSSYTKSKPYPIQLSARQDEISEINGTNSSVTSPLHKQYQNSQAWWNKVSGSCENVQSEIECPVSSTNSQPFIVSDNGTMKSVPNEQQINARNNNVAQRPKPIRMDIDLNTPLPDEETKKEEKSKAKVPSTAFTVPFESEQTNSSRAKLSLQDAARKSTTRRLLRRSAPVYSAQAADRKLAETADPKQYLLKKMLMGSEAIFEESSGGPEFLTSSIKNKPDNDALSEAGTYIVDSSDRLSNQMVSSRCLSDEDDDSSSSTTPTQDAGPILSPYSITGLSQISTHILEKPQVLGDNCGHSKEVIPLSQRESQQKVNLKSSSSGSNMFANSSSRSVTYTVKRNLEVHGQRKDLVNPPSTTIQRLCHTSSGNLRSPTQATSLRHYSSNRTNVPISSVNKNVDFRRGEGGRFSMRGCSILGPKNVAASVASAKNISIRPPFKVGGSNRPSTAISGSNTQKERADMTAWLRRKDYNPMKAVAEARKMQQLKSRAENFISNRSISFHQGTNRKDISFLHNNLSKKWKHNKSDDNLIKEEDSCGRKQILTSYSKDVRTEDLPVLELERCVQELAAKCNRSIELIKNAHHGELSKSVENLLELAVEPSKECQISVADQLDRLSSAFDAIQKYLEAFSLSASVPASPSIMSPLTTPSSPLKSISPYRKNNVLISKTIALKKNLSGSSTNLQKK